MTPHSISCLIFLYFWIREKRKQLIYRTCAIIVLSLFETALNYKPKILGYKIEEFPCLVHKLSVILTPLQYKLH
jgi:hypothetical protein